MYFGEIVKGLTIEKKSMKANFQKTVAVLGGSH